MANNARVLWVQVSWVFRELLKTCASLRSNGMGKYGIRATGKLGMSGKGWLDYFIYKLFVFVN